MKDTVTLHIIVKFNVFFFFLMNSQIQCDQIKCSKFYKKKKSNAVKVSKITPPPQKKKINKQFNSLSWHVDLGCTVALVLAHIKSLDISLSQSFSLWLSGYVTERAPLYFFVAFSNKPKIFRLLNYS